MTLLSELEELRIRAQIRDVCLHAAPYIDLDAYAKAVADEVIRRRSAPAPHELYLVHRMNEEPAAPRQGKRDRLQPKGL